jgi:hypothetical protein
MANHEMAMGVIAWAGSTRHLTALTQQAALGSAQTLPVSKVKPMNKAAVAHATRGPFWITHCIMAIVPLRCVKSERLSAAGLLSHANLLLVKLVLHIQNNSLVVLNGSSPIRLLIPNE